MLPDDGARIFDPEPPLASWIYPSATLGSGSIRLILDAFYSRRSSAQGRLPGKTSLVLIYLSIYRRTKQAPLKQEFHLTQEHKT